MIYRTHELSSKFDSTSAIRGVLVVILALGLAACSGDKKKEPGQSLVKVNGEEITVYQLNDELGRTAPQGTPAAQEAASKQVLEALINRQLLENEAIASKVDRDPKIMQAIERAKAQILAQAYLQTRIAKIGKPAKAEIDNYFQKHPEYFTKRKVFDMNQLVIASKDFNEPLREAVDHAKSLDEVATWLDANKIAYARNQMSRSTADLPAPMVDKLQGMEKGQLFVIKENDRTLLVNLSDIKDSPVTLEIAAPQIEQYLRNQKTQETAKEELTRLRSIARIDYLNKSAADKVKTAAPQDTPAAAAAISSSPAAAPNASNMARGVAGLK